MKIFKIKSILIIVCFTVLSCKKSVNKNPTASDVFANKNSKTEGTLIDTTSLNKTAFTAIIKKIPQKKTPIADSTSFDDTHVTKFLNNQEVNLLQLTKIYPNFHKEGSNYKASPSYKINTHNDIITIGIAIHKGENELESMLINYNLDGKYIDHLLIAYDDIVEGYIRTTSKIEDNIVFKTNKAYFKDEGEEEEVWFFNINQEGTFTQLEFNEVLLKRINIKPEQVYRDFFASEEISDTKTLVIVPKIAKKNFEEYTLDAYVVLVNQKTGNIEASFFEKGLWVVDAIKISSIEAVYNPYIITEDSETVGVKVYYFNDNPVNPYNSVKLTLLERDKGKLKPVLIDFELAYDGGENDGSGSGIAFESVKNITTKKSETTPYYTIKSINKIKNTTLENYEEKKIERYETIEQFKYDLKTKTYQLIKNE